jgi:hypothetical protein
MRKTLKAVMLAVFALVAIAASAQETFKLSGNEGSYTIYYQMSEDEIISNLKKGQEVRVLKSSQGDSIFLVDRCYVEGGRYLAKEEKITVERRKVLPSTWENQVRDTQTVEKLYADRRRHTYFAEAEDGSRVVLKSVNAYGWGISLFGGYEYFKSINAPVFGAGVEFTQPHWMLSAYGEGGWAKYSDAAVNAGQKYMNYRTSIEGGIQPFKFDKFDQHRLYIVAGVKFKWNKTDTKEVEGESWISSWGSHISPVLGLKYSFIPFCSGNAMSIQLTAEQDRWFFTNKGDKVEWGINFKATYTFGTGRDKVKNVSSSELARLKNL